MEVLHATLPAEEPGAPDGQRMKKGLSAASGNWKAEIGFLSSLRKVAGSGHYSGFKCWER